MDSRHDWDLAADAYATAQAAGVDHYRYAFFGPAQVALCGDVTGARLVDIGCGAGYFAREMAARGAIVTGIDISPNMIANARAAGGDIAYEALPAEALASRFAGASFDLATSCLALQDMADPAAVLRATHAILRPGGRCVFSIEHPCTTMAVRHWARHPDGTKQHLCLDRYFERGPIPFDWPARWGGFRTHALHAPLEDWFGWIVAAGFQLRAFREPIPTAEAIAAHPGLASATRMPHFALFDLFRP